jgi:hypothetical protein
MEKFATIFVELNCYEKGFATGEDGPATVRLVPRRVEAPSDLDSLKTEAIHIIGPISLRVVNGVSSSLSEAFRQLGVGVQEHTVSDD